MGHARWFYHPIFVFIFSIIALALSLFLYIYWYLAASKGLAQLVQRFNIDADQVFEYETWVVILILSLLVGIILLGIFIIFVYHQKALQLYRLQHNFINNFTHELKTPVTSLKLYLETFIKHDIVRKEQLKYFEFMLHDVSRLSENINRILDLSKLESKNYKGELTVVNVADMISQYCRDNHDLFRNCQIKLHHTETIDGKCKVNISLFEMLLHNLINNAIKYNNAPQPIIDIYFQQLNNKCIIKFADNGIGFDKTQSVKIFKKFYQIGEARNMSAKGSGLGLYLVQSIARLHHGKVTAASPGKDEGSVFTLILPIKKDI